MLRRKLDNALLDEWIEGNRYGKKLDFSENIDMNYEKTNTGFLNSNAIKRKEKNKTFFECGEVRYLKRFCPLTTFNFCGKNGHIKDY